MKGLWYYGKQRHYRYWHWLRGSLGGNCFLEQSQQWFDDHPFVSSYKGGRQSMEMTQEQKIRRRSLTVMCSKLRKDKERLANLGIDTSSQDRNIRELVARFLPETGHPPPSRWRRELRV